MKTKARFRISLILPAGQNRNIAGLTLGAFLGCVYDADIDQDGILMLDLRTARVPPSVTNHHMQNRNSGALAESQA